jgi:hypothetical protein
VTSIRAAVASTTPLHVWRGVTAVALIAQKVFRQRKPSMIV